MYNLKAKVFEDNEIVNFKKEKICQDNNLMFYNK